MKLPGVRATQLVMLAASGGKPAASRIGKVRKLAPPAMAVTPPATAPPTNSMAMVATSMPGIRPAPRCGLEGNLRAMRCGS